MDRDWEINSILRFVNEHPESYASLAVCRRALDGGLSEITDPVIRDLRDYLENAPDSEIETYYYIVS